jgi:tetratricopeptide (TPR) repeat protein
LTPAPAARLNVDLSSPYGTFIDGLLNLGSGFPGEAYPLLRRAAALSAEARWGRRSTALEGLLSDRPGAARSRYPLLAAAVALNTRPFDEAEVARAFSGSALPLARLWEALLAAQTGDAAARERFAALDTESYPFSAAEGLLYRLSRGERGAEVRAELRALLERQPESLDVLVGGLFVAQTLADGPLEQRLAARLTRLAPAFAYPYERLSQRAFDRDDPNAAAVALRTATRLEPDNDLYWTNLGWAYYLLGVPGESEAASRRALELNPDERVARYNLGLVQVVTGRLGQR